MSSRLPKAVLAGGFAPLGDEQSSNERHSVPPTTSSVRPPSEAEREPELRRPRSWIARVGPLGLIAASLAVALFVSPGTMQDRPARRLPTELPTDATSSAAVTITNAELPAPSARAATLAPSPSADASVEVIDVTAVTVTAAPPNRRRVSPPPRGVSGAAKRRGGHPRPATTVFPEDQPRELFDTRN